MSAGATAGRHSVIPMARRFMVTSSTVLRSWQEGRSDTIGRGTAGFLSCRPSRGLRSYSITASLAIAAILLLRCTDAGETWNSIDASILVLIFAMLIIGKGLEEAEVIELVIERRPVACWIASMDPACCHPVEGAVD